MSAGKDYSLRMHDSSLAQLVPGFELLHEETMRALLTRRNSQTLTTSILDLCCGTGRLSTLAQELEVGERYYCVDNDAAALARVRSVNVRGSVSVHKLDVTSMRDFRNELGEPAGFYVALLGFAIHHFSGAERAVVYQNVLESLADDGLFLIQDLFGFVDRAFAKSARKAERQHLEGFGASSEWIAHYEGHDELPFLEKEMSALASAGFKQINCIFRYLHAAMLVARK